MPSVQYMYGHMLAEGRGVPADLEAARHWLARTAEAELRPT